MKLSYAAFCLAFDRQGTKQSVLIIHLIIHT